MKALLLSEYNRLELTEVPTPEAGPGELLIRVTACGICGSDVHGYDGSSGRRIPPIVMGHEAAGVVAGVGENVEGFAAGDRVTFDSTVSCGECANCRRGDVNLCDRRQVLGVSCGEYQRSGAFADFVTVPARICYMLPDNLAFEEAAMLEAVAVAVHAVALAPIPLGGSALVVGAGTIGLLVQQALRAAGCKNVFVTDVDASRLGLSESLGATRTLLSASDLPKRVADLSDGMGIDVVVEAVGDTQTIALAIDSVKKGGTVVLVGNISPEVNIHLQKVVSRQIRLQGSCASAGEYPRAIERVSRGEIQVRPLISAVAPLAQGPKWFQRLHAREPNLMKVVLTPGEV
jgi:L-iditol 2-dehydrogenase